MSKKNKNPKTTYKRVKAWSVLCSRDGVHRAWVDKDKAREHSEFLNEEYLGLCKHKVIPCFITYTLPKALKATKKK